MTARVFLPAVLIVSIARGVEPTLESPAVPRSTSAAPTIPADDGDRAKPVTETPAKPLSKPIVHDGQAFELANSTAANSVETDEYTTGGEKLGEWTQLVTVQRMTLPKPTSAEAFVNYFKSRIAEDGATLDVLSSAKAASVFAVRFPKSDGNDEQVMVCLAFSDPNRPELLNIVQYALKPTKCPVDVAAGRIKSWRDRFLTQARVLGGTSG